MKKLFFKIYIYIIKNKIKQDNLYYFLKIAKKINK